MPVLSRAVITIAEVVEVARGRAPVSFARPVELDLAASRAVVEKIAASGVAVYGLNTELGAGRDITVDANALEAFQQRVVRNSSGGVGEPLSEEQARAVIYARLVGFTRGGAGVTPALAAQYRELLNRGVYPFVPRTGSVGSADLTHLAAIAAVAAGSGRAIVEGSVVPGQAALEVAGLAPHVLQAHEGLAALSSNAFSVGVGALVVTDARATIRAADAAVALSLTALGSHSGGGSASPFSELIQAAHPSPGQAASAARVRGLLGTVSAASVQDPISFRSAPQITGAAIEAVERAASLVALELNSRTENPLVDIETATMTSGGNFQVLGLALSFEALRLALAHVAGASERRLAKLSSLSADARRSGVARVPGLSWYSSSVLVAELNHLANPVTFGGSSLSDDVEDHSSHAALALQLLERSVALTRTVLAIEALTAAELVLLADAAPASALQTVVDAVRTGLDAGLPVDELVTTLEAALVAVG